MSDLTPATTHVDPSKRSITVRITIPKEAAASFAGTSGGVEGFAKLSVADQQAALLTHLPTAIALAKAQAIAFAPEVGLTDRIGWVEVWDSFAAGVEVVVDWAKGTVEAVAVGITWTF